MLGEEEFNRMIDEGIEKMQARGVDVDALKQYDEESGIMTLLSVNVHPKAPEHHKLDADGMTLVISMKAVGENVDKGETPAIISTFDLYEVADEAAPYLLMAFENAISELIGRIHEEGWEPSK